MSTDNDRSELGEAARRAGSIVTEQIDSIVKRAERRAEEIRNEAERELGEAARRAGSIVTEHIDAMVAGAERRAYEIENEAQRDAEDKRRAAIGSAQTLLERIGALERPLGELVLDIRGEVERVSGELGSGNHVDGQAAAIPAETDADQSSPVDAVPDEAPEAPRADTTDPPEPQPQGEEESDRSPSSAGEAAPQATMEPESDAAATPDLDLEAAAITEVESPVEAETDPAAEDTERDDARPPDIPVTVPSETKSGRGRFTRRSPKQTKKGTFITKEGHCAVCQRTFMARSVINLEASHWRVNGDVGLCPGCQGEGWKLPDGARLPFRRGGS